VSGDGKQVRAAASKGDEVVRWVDPGVLEVIGVVPDLLGLTEHIRAMAPIDRL
jgi:hypothetical protein